MPQGQAPGQSLVQYASQPCKRRNQCIPHLVNGSWIKDDTTPIFKDDVQASFHVKEFKLRDILLSYLGNFLLLKSGESLSPGI
eukprot:3399068-Rhodomonas_salina.1